MSGPARWAAIVRERLRDSARRARGRLSSLQNEPGAPAEARAPDSADAGADPRSRETDAPPWAEPTLIGLLAAAALAFLAFAVAIVVEPDTQLLGATAGGGLALVAAALILAGKRVAPRETAVEERPALSDPEAERQLRSELAAGREGISRRRLIVAAAGTAGTGLAAAAALPVTALGPGTDVLQQAPWRASVLLVDERGLALSADAVIEGSFVTAFPEGADTRELGAPVVVVRVDPATLELPAGRRGWAPEGLLAYSKICTHASCAVSLFRYPLYERRSSGPALVCPCHYSTFDVRRGAQVVFGPAGRPLPQLPLRVDEERNILAAGPLSGSVGPAWFGTDRGRPS